MTQTFRFPALLKLKKPAEYQKVFAKPSKSTDRLFTLLAIKNTHSYSRLGLAIARKNIRKAVNRNLIKRVVRESFRRQQHQLLNIDVVVLAKTAAATTTSDLLKKSLDKHWLKINK